MIKGVIDFNGVKVLSIKSEQLAASHMVGIERADPVVVVPAGSSDVNTARFHPRMHARSDLRYLVPRP